MLEKEKQALSETYAANTAHFDSLFKIGDNFDMVKREIRIAGAAAAIYFVDGLIKDEAAERVISVILENSASLPPEVLCDGKLFAEHMISYTEASVVYTEQETTDSIYGGCLALFCERFAGAVIIKSRSFPARGIEEPVTDKVLRGSRVGFVETLVRNTALLRRYLHDSHLVMKKFTVGSESRTTVILCYMDNRAEPSLVRHVSKKISEIQTDALCLGIQSLSECLVKQRWYNPFPKFRFTERPDAAAASVVEGSLLVLCDNSPQAMILPVSIFDFLQKTDDFYMSPFTGSYLRFIRLLTFIIAIFLTPIWYLFLKNPSWIPPWLELIKVPDAPVVPILMQLIIIEIAIDGLKIASLTTPDTLANSFSVVGGLILGDFAIEIGWFVPQTILYMSVVAICNFTQHSYELGYAFKYVRIMLLVLTAIFNLWGFIAGVILLLLMLVTNKTVEEKRRYLYPLIPFNGPALLSLFVRRKKR